MSLRTRIQRGFSLLELILVLVIIGIIVSAITISISDRRLDQLKLEAQRLQALVALARDDAVISNRELGLAFSEEGYEFLRFVDNDWVTVDLEQTPQFKPRRWPEEAVYVLNVSGLYGADVNSLNLRKAKQDDDALFTDTDKDDDKEPLRPQLMLLSSAELTPFVLRLGYDDAEPAYMQLSAEADGQLSLIGPIYEPMTLDWQGEL